MANTRKLIPAVILIVVLLFTSCTGQRAEYEHETVGKERIDKIVWAEVFYDFFNTFEIFEFEMYLGDIRRPGQLWGHIWEGEVRLTTCVFIYEVEGFDDPVLILVEYFFEEDGITLSINHPAGLLNAYLIRDGELCNDISREEFYLIFTVIEGDRNWRVLGHNGAWRNADINGEELFYRNLQSSFGTRVYGDTGLVRAHYNMDLVLNMLRANM